MTSEISFGTLADVPLRDAWTRESHEFTPWLAQNLDRLSEVIGIRLELTGTEVAVETFSADILARNPQDDTNVLIENQLEGADHRHLGQILTYLAGLDAKTVVWVAPSFRQAHLSAIRWLNEHTDDAFAFFAVRLRVVRIGDSSYAPLLEVLERPNDWDRRLQEVARESRQPSERGLQRLRFWEHYLRRHSDETSVRAGAASNRWRRLSDLGLVVSQYLAQDGVGVFVRGLTGSEPAETAARLAPVADRLQTRIGVAMGDQGAKYFFENELRIDTKDEANWDRMSDWLKAEADKYEAALKETLGETI